MGVLFLFVSAAVCTDLGNLLLSVTFFRKLPGRIFKPKSVLLFCTAYALLVSIYGYFEAMNIVTEHLTITSSRIPATVDKIRIVQISDVHVGQIVRERRIRSILESVKAAAPDMLVSTGDLVDGHQRHFSGLGKLFLEIQPKLGKFAILGNHEHYVGVEQSIGFMEEGGFRVLIDENSELNGLLRITGVDDPHGKRNNSQGDKTSYATIEKNLLESGATGEFRLLLKHRPVLEPGSAGKFDLQLSGHVHKGQIFPFNLLTWLNFPVRTGLTTLPDGSHLYVSRGTGVWGPPIRFLAPPEVTIIDLLPEKVSEAVTVPH
jgi:predicted MPP superfamily phosphohydrolase